MILQFNFNNKTVDIKVTKKPIKNIYMKIDLNNNINVSAPNNSTDKFILNFVNQHIQTFLEIQNNNSTKVNINLEDKTFYLLGQLENFEIIEKISKQNEVINYLVFRNKKYKINKKTVEDIIYNIYKKELLLYLTEAQYRKEQLMNVEHHDIYIRMKQNA
jgi:predicted metal-dependent hydrolase